jgi:hypothetical protein
VQSLTLSLMHRHPTNTKASIVGRNKASCIYFETPADSVSNQKPINPSPSEFQGIQWESENIFGPQAKQGYQTPSSFCPTTL